MKQTFVLLLVAQLVVQTVALTALLNRGGSSENQTTFLASLLRAFAISLGSVVLELWLHHTLGVWVVVMVLAIPVVVLMRHDWATMRFACIVTVGVSLAVLLLSADFDSWFLARLRPGTEKAGGVAQVFSYAQVADKLNFAGAAPKVPIPPEASHAPGSTGTVTTAATTNDVFVSTGATPPALAAGGGKTEVPPLMPDWDAARREIRFGGRLNQVGGKIVVIVNGGMLETNDVFTTRLGPFAYRWRVIRILRGDVVLEKVDARIVADAALP